jgi:L-alanine-DL-glutamate epimerase-like enolase superfamily enzyme
MKITRVEATTHRIPVTPPLLDEPIVRPVVIVTVETDAGITGYGLAGPAQRMAVKELINREIAPLVTGANPLETERIFQMLATQLNPRAQTGAWSSAVSGVDIALWDIKGKHFGEPVWRLLGGAQNPVPAYITFGLLEYSKEQLVEVAKSFVAQGEDKLKMVVAIDNGQNAIEDAARVEAVREAVGDRVQLMADANYLFSLPAAIDLCRRIEHCNLTWLEEPVYGNDARLLADLRRRTNIPISAGQNEGHLFRHLALLQNQSVDILQPNVCYVGGYTQGAKVAAMAQAFNVPIANGGGWPHHNMHLQAAMSNGWRVEFHYLMWKTGEIIYKDPPAPNKGWVTLSEEPGLGLEPNWDALKQYQEA